MGALNIKDTEVAEKARKLARLRGKSITKAVSEALDQALKTTGKKSDLDRKARRQRVDEAIARFRGGIPPGASSYREIMDDMYDEFGLPK